ncbi:hypothetical protein evm_008061 [Chilo suppressalis]|nr:hypothetical protein evm_008061 [Chilo suppressalis]
MASTPKQVNVSNGPLGKRKKSKGNKGSYLTKWLDKTLHHIQDSTPSMETYDSFIHPNFNWQINSSQFAPGYDPYRYVYGCSEPMSLPTLPTYCNPPIAPTYGPYIQSVSKSVQVQRPRLRRRTENKAEEVASTPNSMLSNTNYLQPKNFTDSQDFTSLPPIVTSVADTNSNSDMNTNEKDDGCNTRRFSDPCVQGLPDVARPANGEVESESESESSISDSQIGSRLLTHLLDQIKSLKLANERLNKDLLDTRAELDNIRHQNVILQKGSSANIGAASHTPLTDNGCSNPSNVFCAPEYGLIIIISLIMILLLTRRHGKQCRPYSSRTSAEGHTDPTPLKPPGTLLRPYGGGLGADAPACATSR